MYNLCCLNCDNFYNLDSNRYLFYLLQVHVSLSSAYNKKNCKRDILIKIRWSPFPLYFSLHKTYIKLYFYFSLRLMFKHFEIHVFFTPARRIFFPSTGETQIYRSQHKLTAASQKLQPKASTATETQVLPLPLKI